MLAGICELTLETQDIAALERVHTQAFPVRVLAREDDRGGRDAHFAMSAGGDDAPAGG
jgi:hypothetical protein